MGLIDCPECNSKISEYALSCPSCGCPKEVIDKMIQKALTITLAFEKKKCSRV